MKRRITYGILIFFFIIIILSFSLSVTSASLLGTSNIKKVINYLNSRTGGGVSYISSEDLGSIYAVSVFYQNQNITVYTTKDIKYFISGADKIDSLNSTKILSIKEAGKKLVNYLNVRTGGGVFYKSGTSKGYIYEINVIYQNQTILVYITKEGKFYITDAAIISSVKNCNVDSDCMGNAVCKLRLCVDKSNSNINNIPKTNKPKVELFVMSYCPYGIQAEKGIIPTIKALGNTIDAKIRFVHYTMHGEKEDIENYRQLCIREEQTAKYYDYLTVFLDKGDFASALTAAKIDITKLNICMANNYTIAKKYYAIDSALSQQYGVQGSPTLIINGVEANSGRDSESYLTTVCSAFNKPGTSCLIQLSSVSPSPGFGNNAGSSNNGGCASA